MTFDLSPGISTDDAIRMRYQGPPVVTEEFAYTADEMVQVYREAVVRWADYSVLVIWAASIPAIASIVQSLRGHSPGFTALLTVIVALAGIAYPYWRMDQIRREHRNAVTKGTLTRTQLEFDALYVTLQVSDGTAGKTRISSLIGATLSPTFLYLYHAKRAFILVPRRILAEADEKRVLEILAANRVEVRRRHYR